ncbi:TMF family protein [Fibrella sp. HMF5405]|uniref:TMF family protein n=1 Tax=Fibrella forsythiae TaxID=2817061 RepID=A0ABS3JP80_9BACT|nr:TMF family protein [Fibrella forsythiae]
MGAAAGQNFTNGSGSTFVGNSAGGSGNGGANTFVGFAAGSVNNATNNSFFGYQAGTANTTGTSNLFMGFQAGGQNTTGTGNTFLGFRAGGSNTTGRYNTFMGVQSGLNNTTGSSNFIMGTNAGLVNRTGSGNFFLGDNTGSRNETGSYNVYLGTNAGAGGGSNNLAIGFGSGGGLESGNNNLFLGFASSAGAPTLSNAAAIGNYAQVNVSNAMVLGNGINVGIGNSAPTARLHLTSGVAGQSGLRLENLTTSSIASVLNRTKFLTVDSVGNVILGSTTNGGRESAAESLWHRVGDLLQSLNGESVVIGKGVHETPTGYKLFVEEGVLTEKVKVAVKNTSDWSDHVFASGYQLMALAEVDQFVKVNGHLPGIPSAAQMVEQGNNLHKTDAKLLEKIEELTLYSIQLEKADQAKQQELKRLKADMDELKQLVKQLLEKR